MSWADLQIEEPYRVHQQLRTLAQSLALVHSRPKVTDHEIELVKRVVWSTIPADRRAVLLALCSGDKPTKELVNATGKSSGRAAQVLDELERAKLIERRDGQTNGGRPPNIYSLVPGVSGLKPQEVIDHINDLP
jgi:hypothetical protein